MSIGFELRIQELLQKHNIRSVVQTLLHEIYFENPPFEALEEILIFLLNAGYDQEVLMYIARNFRARKVSQWAMFIEMLGRHKLKAKTNTIHAIQEGLRAQDMAEQVIKSYYSTGIDPYLQRRRKQHFDEKFNAWAERKQNLKDKLNYVRSQHMLDEERRVLEEILREFPDDPDVAQAQINFDNRWADQILVQNSKLRAFDFIEKRKRWLSSEEETKSLQLWLNFALGLDRSRVKAIGDFALLFWFLDAPQVALDLIRQSARSPQLDWMKLEILLVLGLNVEALDWIIELENIYQNNPDTNAACAYARAQAMFALGQTAQAISLMSAIVESNPHYRLSRDLLHEWSEGVRA